MRYRPDVRFGVCCERGRSEYKNRVNAWRYDEKRVVCSTLPAPSLSCRDEWADILGGPHECTCEMAAFRLDDDVRCSTFTASHHPSRATTQLLRDLIQASGLVWA